MSKKRPSQLELKSPAAKSLKSAQIDMAIYGGGRIGNELRELMKHRTAADAPLTPPDIFAFDQMHYHGTKSLDDAIQHLGIEPGATVMDVGSGYGGPARYLAWKHGCKVVAVELQGDVSRQAEEISKLVKLDAKLTHVTANVIDFHGMSAEDKVSKLKVCNELGQLDHMISLLAILHIAEEDRLAAYQAVYGVLRPGGSMYVEDFYLRDAEGEEAKEGERRAAVPLTVGDSKMLSTEIACPHVPTRAEYTHTLLKAGFTEVAIRDVSESWGTYTAERAQQFLVNRERHVRVHGEEMYQSLQRFYDTMATLYRNGRLGGAVITATKPPDAVV
mmetsp:Transcript_7542/g.8574  ORF Transcript_7542/g.8574 Transcript_7542/m.8574 type:complete len:331 (+) Transcript_7542:24-1016(+)|eukprot:CAMPEP_0205830518 /NCGR_PEP_ID=MMETSP0206-20130828/41259_1 /ASSEMBLY_ACC=CAM_ASM_000279 /TAXON_ID=36767 /ORGANISM="Euplotes focardii, Strain TN1" /LENGTH=330 /DNA_ID=CAMNT_0053134241 /DNA_START=19 /DNA_END=1011 /DNA_ORIENTATION=-